MRLLVVLGASGVGKTAVTTALAARALPGVACHHFDDIGVPSEDRMSEEHGGPEAWQQHATRCWIERLYGTQSGEMVQVLEGQTRPSFVLDALASVERVACRMVLLDCSPETRAVRLELRGQPWLANPRMSSWAAYLRGQADALGVPVVHTDARSVDEIVDGLEALVDVLRGERIA